MLITIMLRVAFSLIICCQSIIGISQQIQQLRIADSIVITSNLPLGINVLDINYLNGDFWVRFDAWKPEGIFIELANQKAQSYVFRTFDSSIASEFSRLHNLPNGFLMPKYAGKNKLIYFDTLNRKIIASKFDKKDDYIVYPNCNGLLRTSTGFNGRDIIMSRISMDVNVSSKRKLARSLELIFEKEKLFVRYNTKTGSDFFFGSYPLIYNQKKFLVANKDYFFSTDPSGKKLFVSFQASDFIEVYDINTGERIASYNGKGEKIDKEMLLVEYNEPSDYAIKEFLNLLADSYDEVYVGDSGFVRLYKKGYSYEALRDIAPPPGIEVCPTPKIKLMWVDKLINKRMFLQRFNATGMLLYEMAVPSSVNTFIGYDESKDLYFFWKKRQTGTKGYATVYILKAANQ